MLNKGTSKRKWKKCSGHNGRKRSRMEGCKFLMERDSWVPSTSDEDRHTPGHISKVRKTWAKKIPPKILYLGGEGGSLFKCFCLFHQFEKRVLKFPTMFEELPVSLILSNWTSSHRGSVTRCIHVYTCHVLLVNDLLYHYELSLFISGNAFFLKSVFFPALLIYKLHTIKFQPLELHSPVDSSIFRAVRPWPA